MQPRKGPRDSSNDGAVPVTASRAASSLTREFGFDLDDESWLGQLREACAPAALGRLGPYELLGEIGRGGQGVVYKARQPRTDRVVVLKRLAAGAFATPAMRGRFEREVEAAAALDHPNIVTVYGSELIDGQWVLSMQWIDGVPIDRWALAAGVQSSALHGARRAGGRNAADAPSEHPGSAAPEQPSPRAVLTVFASICDAVAHAHQRGVIHRDLKPSNILIDAAGQPHVLDFGLAKRTGGTAIGASDPSGATATLTHTGDFVGTPAFAAPEQLRGDSAAVDARTDVYSLGAVLYYTLTGRLPFADATTLHELMRFALERDPPPPSMHARRLDREIDAIVLKALAGEPPRRYASVRELGDDVRRYLAGRPVSAHAPSLAYRLRKFVHRRRTALLIAGAGVTLLAATAGVSALSRMQAFHASRERDEAQRVAAAAGLESLMQRAGALEGQKKLVEAEAFYREVYEKRLALVGEEHESTAAAAFALGKVAHGAGRLEEADQLLTQAFEADLRHFGPRHATTLAVAGALADVRFDQADYGGAEALYRLVLDDLRAANVWGTPRFDAVSRLTVVLHLQGRIDDLVALLRERVEARKTQLAQADEPWTLRATRLVASANIAVGDALRMSGDEAAARAELEAARQALATLLNQHSRAQLGAEYPALLSDLGGALMSLGRLDEAEQRFREALSIFESMKTSWGRLRSAGTLSNLGNCLVLAGRHAEAEPLLLRAQAAFTKRENAGSRWSCVRSLVALYEATGQTEKAAHWSECVRSRPLREWAPPGASPVDAMAETVPPLGEDAESDGAEVERLQAITELEAQFGRGSALQAAKRHGEAEALFREVYEKRLALVGAEHESTAAVAFELGKLLYAAGRHDEADPLLTAAFDVRLGLYGAQNALTLSAAGALADLRFAQADYAAAELLYRMRDDCSDVPSSANFTFAVCCPLFATLQFLGRWDEAIAILGPCSELREHFFAQPGSDPWANPLREPYDHAYLARLLRLAGREAEARAMFERAREEFERLLEKKPATGPATVNFLYAQRGLGSVLAQLDRLEEAEAMLRDVIPEFNAARHRGKPYRRGWALVALGDCLLRGQRFAEAEPLLLEALPTFTDPANRLYVGLRLVDLYDGAGQTAKAAHWRECIRSRPLREWAPPGAPVPQAADEPPTPDAQGE